jgi:quercetin dioxygenase-like cupin family protein
MKETTPIVIFQGGDCHTNNADNYRSDQSIFTKGVSKMFKRKLFAIALILALVSSMAVWVGTSKATPQATPGSGVTAQLLASGNLREPVRVKIKDGSKINMDVAQVLTYKITIAPGGYTGWHQHGGPHMIIIASGSLTYYEGNDRTCTGVVYSAGSSILDPGFDTHFVRNEGTVEVVTYVTQLLPLGGIFRLDVPSPGNCSF